MFNEYELMKLIKSRQEETERKAKNAWIHYENSNKSSSSFISLALSKFQKYFHSRGECCKQNQCAC